MNAFLSNFYYIHPFHSPSVCFIRLRALICILKGNPIYMTYVYTVHYPSVHFPIYSKLVRVNVYSLERAKKEGCQSNIDQNTPLVLCGETCGARKEAMVFVLCTSMTFISINGVLLAALPADPGGQCMPRWFERF